MIREVYVSTEPGHAVLVALFKLLLPLSRSEEYRSISTPTKFVHEHGPVNILKWVWACIHGLF